MHLKTRNVNTAFRELVSLFHRGSSGSEVPVSHRPSRNGEVLVIEEPVTVTYTHPKERVLFNSVRDANPFFHVYEALWMLAGRNDVAPLAYYCGRMKEFSDDGETLNGAYGFRWRRARGTCSQDYSCGDIGVDQLKVIVNHLKADPTSRRAVLQMWNVEDDLLKVGGLGEGGVEQVCPDRGSKDVCCNLSVMFSLRAVHYGPLMGFRGPVKPPRDVTYLDMTVTNRSNDLVWGLLGANYVHFTFLQEYVAARLGVEVGRYHHFSNNLHVYKDRGDWRPEELLNAPSMFDSNRYHYPPEHFPLVSDPAAFERELPLFVNQYSDPDAMSDYASPFTEYTEPFLKYVAQPMMDAFLAYKRRSATTSAHVGLIKAEDWRVAARTWIEKRLDRKEKTDGGE